MTGLLTTLCFCVVLVRFLVRDLLLSIGDWTFSLWREGIQQPIFRSPPSSALITCGEWSPTRPSVVYIGKFDGTIDVWDLVDQTNRPSLTKSVVSVPILCMKFRDPVLAKQQQLLAAGDFKGTLHILDIPTSLRKPTASEQVRVMLSSVVVFLVRAELIVGCFSLFAIEPQSVDCVCVRVPCAVG